MMASAAARAAARPERRRILLVTPQPFFRMTGTPINILTMCRALTAAGFEVHLATLPHGEDMTLRGLVVHRVVRLPFVTDVPVGFSIAKLLYNGLLAGMLVRLLLQRRWSVVHAIEEGAFYALPLARMFGVPGMIDLDSDLCGQLREHPSVGVRRLATPARLLRRLALRQAAGAIVMARHLRDLAGTESPDTPVFEVKDVPIEAATRPPDQAAMARLRSELGLTGKRLVVYTGNYDLRQGLEPLVRAMGVVARRHPDATLLVVGGTPGEVQALQRTVDGLGLAAAVRLIGPRPMETMAEYMGLAEVLISPRLEPLATPLKIFSYMASGRPIVATDLPTHTEVLDAETAILVPPTIDGLAEGIGRALADPPAAAAMAARAQRLVQERHTFAVFARQLLAAYETILGAAAGSEPAARSPGARRPAA